VLKRSSKLLIYDSRHYLYCVYRGQGDWSNPNTVSLTGTDGDTLGGVLRQVREKFHLATQAGDWSVIGCVESKLLVSSRVSRADFTRHCRTSEFSLMREADERSRVAARARRHFPNRVT
jgi:hypothetical protein